MNDLYLAEAAAFQNMDYESIDITDAYMFSYVMRNPEICTEMLQCLFPDHHVIGIQYRQLESHGSPEDMASPTAETEKTMAAAFGMHGVRLDVYMDAGDTVYNVEMQTTPQTALNKRARYYQAEVDVNQLPRGGAYDELKPSYSKRQNICRLL